MAANDGEPAPSQVLNVPNLLTAARLLLAIVTFVLLPWGFYVAAMVVFLVAASTDWVDGYWARKFDQVTPLGRIFDPFVDKIIICGMFIFLCAVPRSGILAWMAVVVVGRELMVTVIRSYIERQGGDFSANMPGKLKMVFQCVAVVASLSVLAWGQNVETCWYGARGEPALLLAVLTVSVWLAVLSTIYSGVIYVFAAARLLSATD